MKISIITATYNSSSTIADCINSINNQTYQNIEHIIIDGSSTDQTMEFIKTTPSRIAQIISEPDKGIYDALNKGIQLSTGEIIGFLHSDDCFHSSKTLENIVQAFSAHQGQNAPDGVYGDLVFVDIKDGNKIVRYWKSKPFKPKLLRQGWMPPHPTLFMRRNVYEKHGRFNVTLKCSADYDYILRVFKDNTLNFRYLHETITCMRIGGVSTGGFKNLINKRKEDYLVLKTNKMANPLCVLFLKNILKIPQILIKNARSQNVRI